MHINEERLRRNLTVSAHRFNKSKLGDTERGRVYGKEKHFECCVETSPALMPAFLKGDSLLVALPCLQWVLRKF